MRRLTGRAHPALPRALDVVAERWAGLPPRGRTALVVLGLIALLGLSGARVRAIEERWGGEGVEVLVAPRNLPVGASVQELRSVRLPPAALPARALSEAPVDAVLSLGLPEGAVLTEAHVSASGPAAGLPQGLRALPVAVEESWGVAAGGWVDVWVLGEDGRALAAARARPILELRGEGAGTTALIGLAQDEVTAVTAGLANGRVVLAHAPAPGGGDHPATEDER